jgi:hypothetical protein
LLQPLLALPLEDGAVDPGFTPGFGSAFDFILFIYFEILG